MAINIPVYCSMLASHPPPSTGPNSKTWRAKEKSGNLIGLYHKLNSFILPM